MVVEKDGQGRTSGGGTNRRGLFSGSANKKHEPTPKMVPLLSRRSIIVLVIGLVIGIVGGMCYWFIIPSLNSGDFVVQEEETSTAMWGEYKGPYESTVQIQIVNPGSSYMSLSELRGTAEYYAAKANTFPFLDFLSQELDESAPEYSRTTEELEQMIFIYYYTDENDVPLIELTVIAPTEEETLYLAAFTPHVFMDFLDSEEEKIQAEEYDVLLANIDEIKQTLLEAEQELAYYSLQYVTDNIYNDSTYISLVAKVDALQEELSYQARLLATLIATGDDSQSYLDIAAAVERTSTALAEAKSELSMLEAQHDIDYTGQDLDYQIAEARVGNLSSELAYLTDRVTSLLSGDSDEPTVLEYMVVGTPSAPSPSMDRMRERDAILLGGVLGLGVAWVTLNFRWLVKGMPSSNIRRREEEKEEMA
jgi:hypothetical protein